MIFELVLNSYLKPSLGVKKVLTGIKSENILLKISISIMTVFFEIKLLLNCKFEIFNRLSMAMK